LSRVALIAAVAENNVIGDGQAMPWRLSSDLKRFRRLTMGKPVIMGRKTWQSIGKPLQGRTNIVVTRQPGFSADGALVAPSLDAALGLAEREAPEEIMVIGGGEIYAEAMAAADRLYVTHVAASPAGSVRFPAVDPAIWQADGLPERLPAGEKDDAATAFVIYDRVAGRGLG
jgi:dihydrofolate reductase